MTETHTQTTLIDLLKDHARTSTTQSILQKRYGIWHGRSWADLLDDVLTFASQLQALGNVEGAKIALLSDNRIESLIALYGIQMAGAVPVIMSSAIPYGVVVEQAHATDVTFFVCEDQEQIDKVRDAYWQLPNIQNIIVFNMRGIKSYKDPRVIAYDSFIASEAPAPLSSDIAVSDTAMIVFTPGSENKARPVQVSHENLISAAKSLTNRTAMSESDRYFSFVSLATLSEAVLTAAGPLLAGYTVAFADSAASVMFDIREAAPTVMLGPARVWDKFAATVSVKSQQTGGLREALTNWGIGTGTAGPLGLLSYWTIRRPILNFLGLRDIRLAASFGAPLASESVAFFKQLGVPLHNAYAVTEAGGIIALSNADDFSTLHALDGVRVDLGTGGLAAVSGLQVSGETPVQTGDLCQPAKSGFAVIAKTSDRLMVGDNKALDPLPIEMELRASPFVRNAMVTVAGGTTSLALIEPDFDLLKEWATLKGLEVSTNRKLSEAPETQALFTEILEAYNAKAPAAQHLSRWQVLPRELEPANGELTAALSLRRRNIRNRYSGIIKRHADA